MLVSMSMPNLILRYEIPIFGGLYSRNQIYMYIYIYIWPFKFLNKYIGVSWEDH